MRDDHRAYAVFLNFQPPVGFDHNQTRGNSNQLPLQFSTMQISNSPDITSLEAQVTWDIAGTNPVISLVNLSLGPNLAGCTWWIVAASPTNTPIHEGTQADPDITGNWNTFNVTDAWPRPFGQIEWSGAPYTLTLFVQDTALNVYQISKSAAICRPAGNTSLSKTPYGQAFTFLQVICDQAAVFFQDQTVNSYKGIVGTQLSSILRVIYPIDPTYTIPAPFQIANFSTALVPITYNSSNYQFVAYSVYAYGLGDNVFINIKYQQIRTFSVLCNVDFSPLVCEIVKLDNSIQSGSCVDAADARRRLNLMYPKLFLAFIGQSQPLTGIDVAGLIREIQEIGGFECDCCNAITGVIPQTSSSIGGYIFDIVPVCGDISGNVTVSGNTIQFNLSDVSYVFAIYPGSPPDTTAFTILPSVNGCTKTFYLSVDITQLATDILDTIKDNGALVNLFNSIVTSAGGAGQLIVDGNCIFSSTSTCDFIFGLSAIPASGTFALLSGIKIGSANTSLSFSFNQTNLGGLQTYLNGLGFGSFTVTNAGGGNITITSDANPNDIQSLTYKISSTTFTAVQSRNCTGYVAIDANEVVQNIINYICELTDAQLVTSQEYTICYLDSGGNMQAQVIAAGSTLADVIEAIVTNGCTTVSNLQGVKGLTCQSLQALFSTNSNAITGNDFMFITKGGGICSKGSFTEVFQWMLTQAMTNTQTKTLFCQLVETCGQGLMCAPYDFVNVVVSNFDTACAPVVGIEFTLM